MVDSILSGLSSSTGKANSAASEKSSGSTLGKDDFLQLLVIQLQNQDPLNPLDDKEFIAQMAQFSSLEQMTNVSSGLDKLNETVARQDSLSAVNYIGKSVVADGNTLNKLESGVTPVYFTLKKPAETVTINVYDQNKNIVRTEKLKSLQAGEFNYSWDGKDYTGKDASKGLYSVYFAAEAADGSAVLVDTQVTGTVAGVSKGTDGVSFKLSDGRTVKLDDITMIAEQKTAQQ